MSKWIGDVFESLSAFQGVSWRRQSSTDKSFTPSPLLPGIWGLQPPGQNSAVRQLCARAPGSCLFPSLGSSVGPGTALQGSFLDHRGPRGVYAVRSGSVNASRGKEGRTLEGGWDG